MNISRRSFIQKLSWGAGASFIAPMVQSLTRSAHAATGPTRVVIMVQGNGWNAQENFNPVEFANARSFVASSQYTLPVAFEPLAKHRSKMLLIDGLANRETGDGHGQNYCVLTCVPGAASPGGVSFDQYLGEKLGGATPFKTLNLAVQGGSRATLINNISASGAGKPVPLQASPREAFNALFAGRMPAAMPGTPTPAVPAVDVAKLAADRRKSLLDFALDDVQRAQALLGGPERAKLDEYLTAIRGLEMRQTKLDQPGGVAPVATPGVACGQPPALLDATAIEDKMEVQTEIATLGLLCGLTRVVVIGSAAGATFFGANYEKLFPGYGHGTHHWGHMGSDPEGILHYNGVFQHHSQHLARMVDRLTAAKEGDGSVFDNTVIFWVNDAGDAHHGDRNRSPVLLLGTAGGKIKADGRYVRYPNRGAANYRGLADFYCSIGHAVGAPTDTFGMNGLEPVKGPLTEIMA